MGNSTNARVRYTVYMFLLSIVLVACSADAPVSEKSQTMDEFDCTSRSDENGDVVSVNCVAKDADGWVRKGDGPGVTRMMSNGKEVEPACSKNSSGGYDCGVTIP